MKKKNKKLPTLDSSLGGGILNKQKPRLERFIKNKKQKQILISTIIGIIVLIGGITLYRTFALYENNKTYNVIKGKVPDFSLRKGNITLAYTVDGVQQSGNFPKKDSGLYATNVSCEDEASAIWNNRYWGLVNVEPGKSKNVVCTISFEKLSFSDYIISLADQSTENLEKVEHEDTEQTENKAKIDYRYIGTNPDNYVYFGCEDNCTDDNLYRIIGIIPTQKEIDGDYENRVKLIKANYYTETTSGLAKSGGYAPTGTGYNWTSLSNTNNQWAQSDLNTKVLNEVYWNSLNTNGMNYQNYIEPAVWYLGALSSSVNYTVEDLYKIERSNTLPRAGGVHSVSTNIGLMYPSDLAYSVNKEYWIDPVKTGTTGSDLLKTSWLFGLKDATGYEWFINPESTSYNNNGNFAWAYSQSLAFAGAVIKYSTHYFGIRPSFYLKANVGIKSGIGSKENPYRLYIKE